MPFAVVGSNAVLDVKGKKVRGRAYPWGVVEGIFFILSKSPLWTETSFWCKWGFTLHFYKHHELRISR